MSSQQEENTAVKTDMTRYLYGEDRLLVCISYVFCLLLLVLLLLVVFIFSYFLQIRIEWREFIWLLTEVTFYRSFTTICLQLCSKLLNEM